MKYLMLLPVLILLSGCVAALKNASDAYTDDNASYNSAYMSCMEHDKHKVEFVDSGQKPITLEFAAGNCGDIIAPQHGGKYVADVVRTAGQVGATLGGAIIAGEYDKSSARIRANAEVRRAELDTQARIEEQRTIQRILDNNSDLVDRVIESEQEPEAEEPAL